MPASSGIRGISGDSLQLARKSRQDGKLHEAAGICHAPRRRGSRLAARGSRAAGGDVTFPLSLLGRADEVIEYAFAIYAEGDRPERQVDGDQAQRPAGRPQPEEGPLPLCARPDDGEHPLDEWLTDARRKLIPRSAARANPRGPAAEVADTAVGKAERRHT